MTVPMSSPSESEMGTWLFRVVIAVIGFLLAIAVKDGKKVVDAFPALAQKVMDMEKVQDRVLWRLTVLEQELMERKR
jgi:hypothetical protein